MEKSFVLFLVANFNNLSDYIAEFLSENLTKIVSGLLLPVCFKTLSKAYNKLKFQISLKNQETFNKKKALIDEICTKIKYQVNASRVLFMLCHNGTVTYNNLHLSRMTCISESIQHSVVSIKDTIQNVMMDDSPDYVKYFKKHKIFFINDVEAMSDEDIMKSRFKNNGVESFFVGIISQKDSAIGFLRIEFCKKKNHKLSDRENILSILTQASTEIYQVLK